MISLTIEGIREAQNANERAFHAIQPDTGLGRAVQVAAEHLHRYAINITHRDTTALAGSHRLEMNARARAILSIDPETINPYGHRPSEYGVYEHARGGSHAFYERTIEEDAKDAADEGINSMIRQAS